MATSSLSVRRSSKRPAEASHQILMFEVRQERFALPVQVVQKVILMGALYGATEATGTHLTLYQNQEIPVIDLERRIFALPSVVKGALPPARDRGSLPSRAGITPHYLMIVPHQGSLIGLPLASHPSLRRVPASAFAPLSDFYQTEGNLRCVSALIVPPGEPPIFLLDLYQLFAPQGRSLPASSGSQTEGLL